MAGKPYNGHRSRNAWNVALWIGNDEGLYNLARALCRRYSRPVAAARMLDDLKAYGVTKTPDGVPYTVTTIKAAMVGL